jgi:hypothetical protein
MIIDRVTDNETKVLHTMSKRSVFTSTTVLPAGVTRETVLETLHDHTAMVQLNPNNCDIVPCRVPTFATPEESTCAWYQITDRISYLPGLTNKVTYSGCFHNLIDGMQSHIYAPMGLDIRNRWTIGGYLPGEHQGPVEFGAPKDGLYLKEDVDMVCNILATKFVQKELKIAHHHLVQRLIEKAHMTERERHNAQLLYKRTISDDSSVTSPTSPTSPSIHSERNPGMVSPLTPPSASSNKRFSFEVHPVEMDANRPAVELSSQKEPVELG